MRLGRLERKEGKWVKKIRALVEDGDRLVWGDCELVIGSTANLIRYVSAEIFRKTVWRAIGASRICMRVYYMILGE